MENNMVSNNFTNVFEGGILGAVLGFTIGYLWNDDDRKLERAINGAKIGAPIGATFGYLDHKTVETVGKEVGKFVNLLLDDNIDMSIIRFLDVGDGDCTIFESGDTPVMVDIYNGNYFTVSLDNPIYHIYKKKVLHIQSHPDMDHMGGISNENEKCAIIGLWDIHNTKSKPDFGKPFVKGNSKDWDTYQGLRRGKNVSYHTRSTEPAMLRSKAFPYDIYVLHPTEDYVAKANRKNDWNLSSYVLLFKNGTFKVLLGGDINQEIWKDIYNWTQKNDIARYLLSDIHIYKASHHGLKSGYCGNDILRLMNPKHIIISKENGSIDTAYPDYLKYVEYSDRLWITSKGSITVSFNNYLKATIEQRDKSKTFFMI